MHPSAHGWKARDEVGVLLLHSRRGRARGRALAGWLGLARSLRADGQKSAEAGLLSPSLSLLRWGDIIALSFSLMVRARSLARYCAHAVFIDLSGALSRRRYT